MKKFKLVILILLLVGLLQSNMFSLITSRIEGKVFDEFCNPIKEAIIRLYELNTGLAAPQQR